TSMSNSYEPIRRIGEGAYGKAILVRKKSNNQRCVIKEVMLSRMRSQRERESAKQEVELLKQFDHPSIVRYLDSFIEAGSLHIVMEFCDGGDLSSKISAQRSPFPEEQVVEWFAQMCLALKYVHDKHVIHRDIKPQNIFLMRSGQVKLGDFGVAKTLDCTLQLASTAIGTPYYVSPEIVKSEAYNNKTDIWSLGCVLYELLTLNHAFEAKNEKQLYINIKLGNVMPVSPRYSSEIRSICSAMFRKNPRDRPTVQALLKKEVLLPALLKHISAEEVAAIQQASPASAGQKRPGSAPRPSSASSKRVVAAAAAAYPAAPLSPYAQKLGGGGGGGNESASLAAARRRDQEQRLAAVRRANEQHRQRMQQQQQKEREQDEAKRRQQREEALINAAQTPTPPPAAAVAASPSPSPSPSPRGGDYAAYHAALDNLAKEAQHRPRQSPQPQQQQLHPGVAVPSSSPSASPTPPPAADNQSERAQRLLEDYWERKRLAARIKAQGLGLGAAQAVNPLSPRPAAVAVEETYLRRLEEVRRRNQRERQQLGEDVQQERHVREAKIDALKTEARDRANRLREQMDERFKEASERQRQQQQQQQRLQQQQQSQYPPPPSITEVMQKLQPASASDSEPTPSAGGGANGGGGGGITRVLAEIGASSSNSAAASADASNGDDQEAQKRRKKESILRYINRKGEPPSVPQQQPPPPDAGVRSAWDSIDCDVDRLDRLPLRLQGSDSSSASADSPTSPQAPTAAPSSARQTPRAWGARADDTGFLRRLGNAPILSGTLVDSDSLPEREVDGEGEVDGKADSESVKSPAHSDLSQVETAEASAAAATAAAAVAEAEAMAAAGRAEHVVMEPELSRIPELVEPSPSISDASASTGHSLLDQVAFEPDAERPQKEASANFVDDEKPGKSGATAGKGGVDLERTDMQLAIYQSLKDFALSAATAAAATDDEVEAAEQLLLSSLTLEEAEELAEVERSFHRVLNDPEPSPSDAKDGDTEAEADDAQCSRTLKQALTSGKFDSPKSLLRTCSLPDLVDGADAGASGEISADSTATVVSVEAASLPSRPRQRPASSSAAAVAAAATTMLLFLTASTRTLLTPMPSLRMMTRSWTR
ncbi:hypothetical protein BOX15_Mlig019498g2, partial [Macrostomum lignano]